MKNELSVKGAAMEKKVALVTGASRGIGRQISLTLAKEGMFVVVNYCGSEARAKNVLEEIRKNGGDGVLYQCDVADYQQTEAMAKELIKSYGHVDVLVNNAGVSYIGLLQDMSSEDWDKILHMNLTSVFNCCKLAIPYMVHQKQGKIINISSVWGVAGASCEAAYSATKGGINALTRALAKELGPSNIQVNAIACGAIDTEMNQWMEEDELIALVDEIPAGRLGKAEEVADLAYHLGYKESYLTGQIIGLDGGWI